MYFGTEKNIMLGRINKIRDLKDTNTNIIDPTDLKKATKGDLGFSRPNFLLNLKSEASKCRVVGEKIGCRRHYRVSQIREVLRKRKKKSDELRSGFSSLSPPK